MRLLFVILISIHSNFVWGQQVLENFEQAPLIQTTLPELVEEKVEQVSQSKRIFIITNQNKAFSKGDFITLFLGEEMVARALAAKTDRDVAGIKILKIYSISKWKLLSPGSKIRVLRGDDSYYANLKKQKTSGQQSAESKIDSEEDLYNETLLEEDLSLEENKNRALKTDNIVGFNVGRISGLDNDGGSQGYLHLMGFWMYQVADNIWGELLYGQSTIKGFPDESLNTKLSTITLRVKYTIQGPFFSYIQPYAGFQIRSASSPNAGVQDDENPLPESKLDLEKSLISELEQNTIVFGATVLKRLVPGWFAKLDLGTDIISLGLSIEF